jgi:LysR family transcriptional regulator, nod-box dependent transcriptional activator
VHEALELIRSALDAQRSFDPANDRRSFRLSCSDYSVLMLIGPLVRALAADAPGSSSRSYRGSQMPRERCSTATSTS